MLSSGGPYIGDQLQDIQSMETPKIVGVVAIDIDHFKQVNDNYGHSYGDIVLRALAIRLEEKARRVTEEYNVQCVACHASGEEFSVLLAGTFSTDAERGIVEGFRAAIDERPLPDDAEWQAILSAGDYSGLVCPPIHERKITISAGYSSTRSISSRASGAGLASILKDRADSALYRAKATGRNKAVAFEDILIKYGRILEHHLDTNIVAIDLGREVDVKIGQEFLVYHPLFTGDEPFLRNDGRTTKRLGYYPRVSSGRVEIVNVQREISFGFVRENRGSGPFPRDSVLESVPLGSITHLLHDDDLSANAPLRQPDLEARIQNLLDSENQPFSLVVSLSNSDKILESHGAAAVNKILSDLYLLVKAAMPFGTSVGQLQLHQIACVGLDREDDFNRQIREIRNQLRHKYADLPKITFGTATHRDRLDFVQEAEFLGDRDKELDPRGCLTFARYAALAGETTNEDVMHFRTFAVTRILYQSRSAGKFAQFEEDVEILSKLGVNSASMINQRAIAAFTQGDAEKAERIFEEVGDSNNYFDGFVLLNIGMMKIALEKNREAIALYRRYRSLKGEALKSPYLRHYAIAAFKVSQEDPMLISPDEALGLLLEYRASTEDQQERLAVDGQVEVLKRLAAG